MNFQQLPRTLTLLANFLLVSYFCSALPSKFSNSIAAVVFILWCSFLSFSNIFLQIELLKAGFYQEMIDITDYLGKKKLSAWSHVLEKL